MRGHCSKLGAGVGQWQQFVQDLRCVGGATFAKYLSGWWSAPLQVPWRPTLGSCFPDVQHASQFSRRLAIGLSVKELVRDAAARSLARLHAEVDALRRTLADQGQPDR